jgi:RNA polymerase sigma-70 factor (ECF subfamily)
LKRFRLPQPDDVRSAVEERFRLGHGRVMAALTRRFGVQSFVLVENAVQDAYVRALERWPHDGMPEDREQWIVRVAHNALIDGLRREHPVQELEAGLNIAVDPPSFESDDELRLMFLCCDPVLTRAAQIALVLNVTFGLGARQIAKAFVSDERTVAQRIVRAKQRLRDQGVRFDVPEPCELPARLAVLLDVIYVVFSEGSHPTDAGISLDPGLCNEALRLVRLLTMTPLTSVPTAFALRALLCFHASRAPARMADDGSLLLMPEQDRARWDTALVTEAFACLQSAGTGDELSRFHLEAAIAACHAMGTSYAATDWTRIVELYEMLRELAPSLVVDVNRALAIAMIAGARTGLDELDAIPEREILGQYPYALAAHADLYASLGDFDQARQYLDRALEHQSSQAQHALLRRKRMTLEAAGDGR